MPGSQVAIGHRLGESRPAGGQDHRPYRVDCWRLDELDESSGPPGRNSISDAGGPDLGPEPRVDGTLVHANQPLAVSSMAVACQHPSPASAPACGGTCITPTRNFPLSADHLLNIIQYNVLVGLIANKTAIGVWPSCETGKTRRPNRTGVPDTLMPTVLQMRQHHSSWIDMMPFPRVRDNLIRWQGSFDHAEFLRDLIGETGGTAPPHEKDWREIPPSTMTLEMAHQGAADGNQQGLIVWGEAHELSSWELTPGFLSKWMWAVEGCEEFLIEMSNRWRLARGEQPMRLTARGPREIMGS
ncbi:hypothetical protein B0T11DRAFT_145326 [Plectosphaerella cucumerina]|uniref:Uncharacterized protein n=1 Tax=Plectosphaerella cucumerina TaxID=40658 RepID=A0A8K0T650_9PEZI|nr:hypothetical protein B0T11DRAFT_145326 [Plectosphaerella cucumerina]